MNLIYYYSEGCGSCKGYKEVVDKITQELKMDAQRLLNVLCVDDNEWKDKEDMNDKINELFKFLSKRLNEVFTPAETDIFLIYYRLKSEKAGISYEKMAK